jgi:adenylate cyclase
MCAPLKARGRLLGALYVDNLTRPDRFNQEDLEFLSAFANQAAIAVDNAVLSSKLAEEAVARSNLLRFFPPTSIEAILAGGASLEAMETEATALFCDVSGYTELSSALAPRDVIGLLNEYFPVMADVVFKHEGTLEKYIGDALLAVWGAPLPRPLAIHVGVNTGLVAAGNIGSSRYLQYATIGDATNVASRICDAAAPGEIVVDARTAQGVATAGMALESLGRVALKGKAEPEELFRVSWR